MNEDSTTKLEINNVADLQRAYMRFVRGGGLYIPSVKKFRLGDKFHLSLLLPKETTPIFVQCKVIWVIPEKNDEDIFGAGVQLSFARKVVWAMPRQMEQEEDECIGVQFLGENSENIKNKIEQLIAMNTIT